jgi:hypothetical protein
MQISERFGEETMTGYERILRVVILIDGLLGLVLLLWPSLVAPDAVHHHAVTAWRRGVGLSLILLSLALLPAAVFSLANRYLAVLAAASQLILGLFFAFSGARFGWLLAIYFFVSAYLLLAAFWRGLRQYLMSKP